MAFKMEKKTQTTKQTKINYTELFSVAENKTLQTNRIGYCVSD